MTDRERPSPSAGLPGRVSESLEALWTHYAGAPPGDVQTAIRGNVIICTLSGGVVEFSEGMVAPPTVGPGSTGDPAGSDYRTDVIAAVVDLTHQPVRSLVSSHDGETDVATEVFTLAA
jgi:hypothetical protein